jgi:predicted kinase
MTDTTKDLIVLRGISGSGKSTLAASILEEAKQNGQEGLVCSTDDYFVNKATNVYEFDPTKLGDAHKWNQTRAFEAMKAGCAPILIDNTHTQCWEAKPYVEKALEFGYNVKVRETTTPWCKNPVELAKRNQHGVPEEAIRRMLERWENDFSVEVIMRSQAPVRSNRGRGGHHRGSGRGGRK